MLEKSSGDNDDVGDVVSGDNEEGCKVADSARKGWRSFGAAVREKERRKNGFVERG